MLKTIALLEGETAHIQKQVSITADPLLLDELPREEHALTVVQTMLKRTFRSAEAAERTMERLMMGLDGPDLTNEESAYYYGKRKVVEAFATNNGATKIASARSALNFSPNCAEAYIALAEMEPEYDNMVALLSKGMNAGATLLDASRFLTPDGYFWQHLLTRPYMRCATALALTHREYGQTQKAVELLQSLLKLNPYDNQGIRFHLLNCLLEQKTDHDLFNAELIDPYFEEYKTDKSAFVKYAYALWSFRKFGAGTFADNALEAATKANPYVPAILCTKTEWPKLQAKRVVRESAAEAIAYQRIGFRAWGSTGGALRWLEERCARILRSKKILRGISAAQEFDRSAPWAVPMPVELWPIFDQFECEPQAVIK